MVGCNKEDLFQSWLDCDGSNSTIKESQLTVSPSPAHRKYPTSSFQHGTEAFVSVVPETLAALQTPQSLFHFQDDDLSSFYAATRSLTDSDTEEESGYGSSFNGSSFDGSINLFLEHFTGGIGTDEL
jgi:hypothetical protein